MRKATHKRVKFTPEETAYELPDKIDTSKLRPAGKGTETVDRLLARSKRVIGLDPDVAAAFRSSEEVNEALRLVQKMREIGKSVKRRKSA